MELTPQQLLQQQFKKAEKQVKQKQVYAAENKQLRKLFMQLAPLFSVSPALVRDAWDYESADGAINIRDTQADSPLAHIWVKPGFANIDIFTDIRKTPTWWRFVQLIEQDTEAYLVFKIKGLGHWVITLNEPVWPCPGKLRCIVPSDGEAVAHIMPLPVFMKGYGHGDQDQE
jgi:hypothetical protein